MSDNNIADKWSSYAQAKRDKLIELIDQLATDETNGFDVLVDATINNLIAVLEDMRP